MNFRIEYQPFNYMICLLLIKYIYFMCRCLNLVRNLLATRIATQITILLKWGRNWTPPVKSISTPSLLPFFLTQQPGRGDLAGESPRSSTRPSGDQRNPRDSPLFLSRDFISVPRGPQVVFQRHLGFRLPLGASDNCSSAIRSDGGGSRWQGL